MNKSLYPFLILAGLLGIPYLEAREIKELGNGIKRVVDGNNVFSYQENLIGTIDGISENEDKIVIGFTGWIRIYVSGTQLGGDKNPEATSRSLQFYGSFFIIISKWEQSGHKSWSLGSPNWKDAFALLEDASKEKREIRLALHTPKLVFANHGDLLAVEASQIAIIDEYSL